MVEVEFITKSSTKAQLILLQIFNEILSTKVIPESWKEIKIFTQSKKDVNPNSASDYRPLGIVSVMRKLFEKILLGRLELFVESYNKLSPFQFGFRKSKNIYHNLFNISCQAYKAIGEKMFMPTFFWI